MLTAVLASRSRSFSFSSSAWTRGPALKSLYALNEAFSEQALILNISKVSERI
jgi:hypothetical protein